MHIALAMANTPLSSSLMQRHVVEQETTQSQFMSPSRALAQSSRVCSNSGCARPQLSSTWMQRPGSAGEIMMTPTIHSPEARECGKMRVWASLGNITRSPACLRASVSTPPTHIRSSVTTFCQ
eukprot:3107079-Rhodomonas_salina.1